jgi:hypothetical protein
MALTERLAIVIDANADKAIAAFRQVGGAAKGLSGDVGKAGGLVSNLGGQLGGLAGAAGPAALAGAGAALAKFAASGISAFVDLAGRVKEFRRVAGGTTEDASRLVAAFSAVGVDATTAAGGVFQLEKHLATGADKLAAFGVHAVKDSKGNTDMSKTLLSVADAYRGIGDPVQKAALLTAAFGRTGAALVPLLSKSREEIKAFFDEAAKSHQILTPDDIRKATEYKLAMHNLGDAFKGLEIEAGKSLVPFLTDVADATTGVIHLTDSVGGFIAKLAEVPAKATGLSPGSILSNLAAALPAGAGLAIIGAIGVEADKTTGSVGHLGLALAETGQILAGYKDVDTAGLDNLDKALFSAGDADRALVDAHHNTADAQAALNKLLKEGAVDAQKVADAQRSLADASRSVGHAQREQADAQKAFDLASEAAVLLGTDTAATKKHEAANALADANDNVASALDRQKAAQTDLDKAKAGDPDYQLHLADAKNKVADATFNESQRSLASVAAHDAETSALSDNADQVQRLYDKYQALIKLHPDVALALGGNLAALGPVVHPPPSSVPTVPNDAWKGTGGPAPGTTVNNNVTVNATNVGADARAIAREIVWNLG